MMTMEEFKEKYDAIYEAIFDEGKESGYAEGFAKGEASGIEKAKKEFEAAQARAEDPTSPTALIKRWKADPKIREEYDHNFALFAICEEAKAEWADPAVRREFQNDYHIFMAWKLNEHRVQLAGRGKNA